MQQKNLGEIDKSILYAVNENAKKASHQRLQWFPLAGIC